MKSPVVLLSSLFDDVERLEPGVKGLDRDLFTIESRFKHEGDGFLAITLSSLCDAIDYGLASGRFTCPTSFSRKRGEATPKFLSGLLCKVFDPKTGQLLNMPSINAVKHLREILRMFKKLTSSPKSEAKLHSQAVRGFIETDNDIANNSFDSSKVNLFRDVSKMMLGSLHTIDYQNIPCKHGPGGVAERASTNRKWSVLRDSCFRNSYLSSKYGLDISTSDSGEVSDSHDIGTLSFDEMLYVSDLANGLVPQLSMSGCAKLLSVPKSAIARRTITMEPTLNMFIQQGLNTVLRDSITKCRILRNCLALTDQSKNQNLAMIGSRTGELSTIDLSSASDLLDLNLVKLFFATKQQFLTAALDCRSSHCDTGLFGVIELRKFAGMGNALTFPVQSIIFATLAICGVLCTEGLRPSYGNVMRAARRVRVYGDDIIIETKHVARVFEWLASFGLKVNQKKSFTEGFFRESCGVDAFRGNDVTPIYVRHWSLKSSGKSDLVASLVSTSNQLWFKGLYKVSETCKQMVEDLVGPLPLVSRFSQGLGWHSRVDTSVSHKWDEKLQRLVFRGLVVQSQRRPDPLDGYAALSKCLHQLEQRKPNQIPSSIDGKHLQSSVKRFHVRLRKRWLPTLVGTNPSYS